MTLASIAPLYQQVRQHILDQIAAGELKVGEQIPSEMQLVRKLNASRMTVNRALRELSAEGILVRVQGVGTFVGDQRAHGHPLQVRNIADEIRERGHVHSSKVIKVEACPADSALARSFSVEPGSDVYHSVIIHYENGAPIQVEDRYVNPAVVPDYKSMDFTKLTPHEYLIRVAPLQQVEHVVQARMPTPEIRKYLAMAPNEPCLVVQRRTWTADQVASVADLHYPASRYELSSRFRV